jgi:hypothetical protein
MFSVTTTHDDPKTKVEVFLDDVNDNDWPIVVVFKSNGNDIKNYLSEPEANSLCVHLLQALQELDRAKIERNL